MRLEPHTAIHVIDLFGTGGFAMSGALRAMERRPDFVGMLLLAGATAVGGGVLRDVVLQRQVFFLTAWEYPLVVLLCVSVAFFFPALLLRRETMFRYFDAIGLGVFSAITTNAAWQTPPISAISILFLAMFTACAGGVIRDTLINRPSLVLQNELYVTPVVVGSAGLMIVRLSGGSEVPGLVTAMLLATILRCAAVHWDWRLPRLVPSVPQCGSWDEKRADE
jgi:uncharacterized membrane protein YeiH